MVLKIGINPDLKLLQWWHKLADNCYKLVGPSPYNSDILASPMLFKFFKA